MSAGLRLSALAALLLVLPACSDSSGPEGTPQDLSGTYTIVSFSQGTSGGVIPVPGATGTVTLTATTYSFDVEVPPLHIVDNGTYSAVGTSTAGTWNQESTDDPTFQSTGTYAFDPATNRLTLDTTVQGTRNVIELQKT